MSIQSACIIGAGAVGLTLAACFYKAAAEKGKSAEIWLVVKNNKVSALSNSGIEISGHQNIIVPKGSLKIITLEDIFYSVPAEVPIWLSTKAFDVDPVLEALKAQVESTNSIVLLSNGLGIFFQAAQVMGRRNPLIRVLPSFGVQRVASNKVILSGSLTATIAYQSQNALMAERIRADLESAGVSVTVEKDIATAEWHKAVVNLVVNSICTLEKKPNGALLEDKKLRDLASEVLKEIRAVALKDGFNLEEITDEVFFRSLEGHKDNLNSTLIDLQRGGKTEIEYLQGRFVRLAHDYGVETPHMNSLYESLKNAKGPAS